MPKFTWPQNPDEHVTVELTPEERFVLGAGLREWGGPARPTEELAVALGFSGVRGLLDDGHRIQAALEAGESLSRMDWLRALFATEVVFISNVMGSGLDWVSTVGRTDEETIRTLRGLQRKLSREVGVRQLVGAGLGTRTAPGHEG